MMADRDENQENGAPRANNLFKIVMLVVVSTICFGLGMGYQLFRYFESGLPSIAKMELEPPNLVTRVFARDSSLLAELYTERRTPVALDMIPAELKQALIAVEDRKFYSHWGIDIWGIIRALYINQVSGQIRQGGSTITQQLARELFLTRERTYTRKIREAILSWQIERTYTKDEILERYFNQIYFGSGAWGIAEAARTYYDKQVDKLDLAECALMAGLPNAPSRNSPLNSPENAMERRNWVLTCMAQTGAITQAVADSVSGIPIRVNPVSRESWKAPYFVDYVRGKLLGDYSEDELYHRGLQIYTTLDLSMQQAAEKYLEEQIQLIESGQIRPFNHKTRREVIGDDSLSVRELTETEYLQGALVAMDPGDGGVRVMVGGRNFWESKFNRAVQALRQPGSAFKPFVYTAAIDNGIPACQVVEDSPIAIEQADGTLWRPSNYTGEFRGAITMRAGIISSINLVAIKTLMTVGAETVAAYARRMGITTRIPAVESIAVGSADVYPIELVSAYTTFPNLGVRVGPMTITAITDRNGNLVRRYRPMREEVLGKQTAYIVLDMMRNVVDFGTGAGTRRLGFTLPAGGKTGTTNNYTDAWFVGYTADLVCGVWIGFDQPRRIVNRGTGSVLAVPVWANFMRDAHEGMTELHEFPAPPEGLTTRLVCKSSGLLATRFCPEDRVYTEMFKVGTEPADYEECYVHKPSIYSR
ncbi:MAG: PBP1A family penicillin-binding protein [Candidatus Glassbacteria bacterium]|nr:PBP1A family penicillin-binding protein [Candidatus Glassbacteria bacterium]